MTNLMEIYKCEVCGNIVELVHPGKGQLVCCGQPMKLLVENTTDASQEKHVPVIEEKQNGYVVKIGAVPHPMEEKHFIEWIELVIGGHSCRQFLKPGQPPEVFFPAETKSDKIYAREYCNLHGLWKK